jgi:hypothetical protein
MNGFITQTAIEQAWREELAELKEQAAHDTLSELMARLAQAEAFAKSLPPASSVAMTTQPSKPGKPSQAELEKRWHAQQARRHAQQLAHNQRLHNRQHKIGW